MERDQCRTKHAIQEEEPTAASNICGRVVGLHRNSKLTGYDGPYWRLMTPLTHFFQTTLMLEEIIEVHWR